MIQNKFLKVSFCFKDQHTTFKKNWKIKGIHLLSSDPQVYLHVSQKKKNDGLYRFLTAIWPSLQKERISCSWLTGFCSFTKLKPYSPASSTLDERRWGQKLSYSYPPRNSMKVGPSQMNCATCLRRFMGMGAGEWSLHTGEWSLHTNEVSKKYLA